MKHKWNTFFALVGIALFLVSLWQVDFICAPILWEHKAIIDLLPFWHMLNIDAYVMFLIWAVLGFAIFGFSLWFWEDDEK